MPHRDGAPHTQSWCGDGHRPRDGRKKTAIERAYTTAEALGIPVWTQDEAGPYQAIPQPGPSWQPIGQPARQPHEYVRGGTAKLLTLFRPATGELRAQPVASAPNTVLHPWLKDELTAVLAALPPLATLDPLAPGALGRRWSDWDWHDDAPTKDVTLPPVRMLLIWDNLAGHKTLAFVQWCAERGILLLYTPLGGSWLNMAESIQRIISRRALDGQHPQSALEIMTWLAATVRGWNAQPTAFVWGGKRQQRRWRARQRRHAQGGSGAVTHRPLPRPRRRQDLLCA